MATSYTNIEKSQTRAGEYVGYANGVWRVRKAIPARGSRYWTAVKISGPMVDTISFYGDTLASVSARLSKMSA